MAQSPGIEVDVPRPVLERLLAEVEEVWQGLGETDPYWSVLTSLDRGAPVNVESFFQTGKRRIDLLSAALARNGLQLASYNSVFELGCGVGRLSVWLARKFKTVIAADISASHLALAVQAAAERHLDNIEFRRIESVSACEKIEPYDVFFSMITLQHNPPPVMKYLLEMFLSRIRPGGLAYFQIPTQRENFRFNAERYLAASGKERRMEMFVLPQPVLFEMFEDNRLHVLEVEDDGQCGPKLVSNTFLLQKY